MPESRRQRGSRLRWLRDVLSLAEERGLLAEIPWDSPEIRAHRRAIRSALAGIRV
jgi:hypothetical protein